MTEMPAGWKWSTVGDAGRLQLGRQRSPRYHSGPNMRPYLRVANVFEDRIDLRDIKQMDFAPDEFERYRLREGDVLLNEGQTPELLGRPAIYRGNPPEVCFTNSLIRFQANPNVDPRWALTVFRHHMHSGRFTRESRITTNIAHLSIGRLRSVEFPIPPIEEQRRIVDILEDHLSRLDAANQDLSGALARAEQLRTSVILHATSSTAGATVPLGDVAMTLRNGIFVSRPGKEPDGVAILRIGAVRPLRLDLSDLRYSGRREEELRAENALLEAGDLLFTRYNGNPRFVAACAVVPQHVGPLTWPDKLIRVVVDQSRANPTFVAMTCSVGAVRAQIDALIKTTSGQTGISGRDLRSLRLRLPTLEAQECAVAQAREGLTDVGRVQDSVRAAVERSEALRRALLRAAVSGQLTKRSADLDQAEEALA